MYSEEDIANLIPALHAYAYKLCRCRDNADDLVQDALERAWRSRSNLDPNASLRGWVFVILRNRFIDQFRASLRVEEDIGGRHASRLFSNPDQHWRLEYLEFVQNLGRFSGKNHQALVMVLIEGMTHEQAASSLGMPLGTLKALIRRARATLFSDGGV